MGKPHVVVIPVPAQGHVIPHMELSQKLAKQGIKISFVNTESNHKRVLEAIGNEKEVDSNGLLRLVSMPDGLEEGEGMNLLRVMEAVHQVMPRELKKFIEKVKRSEDDDDKITCVVADLGMGWAFDVAAELGIRSAAFWTSSMFQLALCLSIPKLIDDGLIDENGFLQVSEHKMFQLSPTTPPIDPKYFLWLALPDSTSQKAVFHHSKRYIKAFDKVDRVLCNSSLVLEAEEFSLVPKVLPVGPLSASNRLGNFWSEDTTCLKWLDRHPPGSVIYVAFGSIAVFGQNQFQELALGLELSNRPFLWVVRPDIITKGEQILYPQGFEERIASRGKVVGWASQGSVLAHPATACFLSHCGWNSTIEGLSNGIPFLCWPYHADQFFNETFICEIWKVGMKFKKNERNIITKEEIRTKVEELFGDQNIKERAAELKERLATSVSECGSSNSIFNNFTEWIKS